MAPVPQGTGATQKKRRLDAGVLLMHSEKCLSPPGQAPVVRHERYCQDGVCPRRDRRRMRQLKNSLTRSVQDLLCGEWRSPPSLSEASNWRRMAFCSSLRRTGVSTTTWQ